jgi:hypothetical protein
LRRTRESAAHVDGRRSRARSTFNQDGAVTLAACASGGLGDILPVRGGTGHVSVVADDAHGDIKASLRKSLVEGAFLG